MKRHQRARDARPSTTNWYIEQEFRSRKATAIFYAILAIIAGAAVATAWFAR